MTSEFIPKLINNIPSPEPALGAIITHLPLDIMVAFLADDIFKPIFSNENDRIPIQISLKFVAKGPIDKNVH